MATIEEWNQRYRSSDKTEGGPSPVVVRAAALSTPGRALDIACGTGRNALFLARQRWQVAAIDGAVEAIRRVKEEAETHGLSIDTAVIDLERERIDYPAESFDLIIITHYLQRDLFPLAATLLRPGGLCAAAIRLIDDSGRRDAPGQHYRVAPDELRRLFENWNAIDYREENGVAEIIARRHP